MKQILKYICYSVIIYVYVGSSVILVGASYTNNGNIQNPVNENNCNPKIEINCTFMNITEITTMVSTKIKALFYDVKNRITAQDYRGMHNQLKQFLWKKKYRIGVYTTSGLYGALSAYLFFEYYLYIASDSLWAQWKSDYTFGQLCEMPQQQLGKELVLAVQAHDVDPKNPINFAQPLITFMYAIDKEIKRLERYVTIARTVHQFRLGIFFPTNQKKINHTVALLERAHFVKHIFLSWLAEYNMATSQVGIGHQRES